MGLLLTLLMPPAAAGTCTGYSEPTLEVEVEWPELDESSGLAPAWLRPGIWYTHEDSGGAAELYAFQRDGTPRGAHAVTGAAFVDWEDLAAGPCPEGGRCLFIGDVGDNKRNRPFVTVYAVAEPSADGEELPVLAKWEGIFPDSPQNIETLLVHPRTGQITLISKEGSGVSRVYNMPVAPTSTPTPMNFVAELALSGDDDADRLATGGAWDAEGQRVVVRTLGQLFEWDADGCGLTEPWGQAPRVLEGPEERQGEAVSYDPQTGALLTTSEGSPMPLSRLDCQGLDSTPPDCGGDSGADSGGDSERNDSVVPDDSSSSESDPDDSGEDHNKDVAQEPRCSCAAAHPHPGTLVLPGLALLGAAWARTRRRVA